jgi:hypothetical protein
MRTGFIAAALVLISLWGLSAPLVLAATARQTGASRTHACCPSGNFAFAPPIFVSPAPATMPCGGQSPCCAKQAPAKPALLALNQENRPGLESAPIRTSDGARNDRASIAMTSAGLSPSLFLHSAVLRI